MTVFNTLREVYNLSTGAGDPFERCEMIAKVWSDAARQAAAEARQRMHNNLSEHFNNKSGPEWRDGSHLADSLARAHSEAADNAKSDEERSAHQEAAGHLAQTSAFMRSGDRSLANYGLGMAYGSSIRADQAGGLKVKRQR
jgi:hypothetical protein